jgi:hypothetical protein
LVALAAALLALLGPLPPLFSLWQHRRFARLQRTLQIYNGMPAGRERDAWEKIVVRESASLRERLGAEGKRDETGGYVTAGMSLTGLGLQLLQVKWTELASVALLVWFALGLTAGVAMIVTGRRQKREDARRFAWDESPLLR